MAAKDLESRVLGFQQENDVFLQDRFGLEISLTQYPVLFGDHLEGSQGLQDNDAALALISRALRTQDWNDIADPYS